MAEAKWVLVIPRKLLNVVNLWPNSSGRWSRVTYLMMLVILIFVEIGQVCYFVTNIKDITAMAATMSTISTTFQAIVKSSVIFFYSQKLKEVVVTIDEQFWCTTLVNEQVQKQLKLSSRVVAGNMLMVLASAFIFAIGLIGKPLREGVRELPLISLFPFDWKQSPVYEIMYFIQAFADVYLAIISICGHDDLFLAICFNCLVQFKILKEVLVKITRGNLQLRRNSQRDGGENKEEEKKVYIECVEHHVLLLRVYDNVEKIFSLSNFVQLLCSVTAICVSSFLIVMTNKAQLVHLASYCLGHILQLFLCCAAANELSYESQNLANFAFNSDWYAKKDMIMTLMLAQKPKKLSALGVVEINYATFISVLRLSFSFYTLLSKIVGK